jgi:predicted aspartyl protease
MKKKTIFLCALFLAIACSGYSQNANRYIVNMLNAGRYFELEQQYPTLKSKANPSVCQFAELYLDYAFNKPTLFIQKVSSLIVQSQLADDKKFTYEMMWEEQLYNSGQYTKAANVMANIMKLLDKLGVPPVRQEGFLSLYRRDNALGRIDKPQLIRSQKETTVKMCATANEETPGWYLPVTINDLQEPFLFDTGASVSMVTEAFARKHHIAVLADSILIPEIGQHEMQYARLGVINSLQIGDMEYRNMPVYILPTLLTDSHSVGASRNGVAALVGLNFMRAIGRVTIHPQQRSFSFLPSANVVPAAGEQSNLIILDGVLYVDARSDTEIHRMLVVDTGAAMAVGLKSTSTSNVALQIANYTIHPIKMEFGGDQRLNLSNGRIGFHFFDRLQEVTIDFNRMILSLK